MRTTLPIFSAKCRFLKDETGTTSVEFLAIFPLFFVMFALALESGFLTTQKIFVERALDMSLRKISLSDDPDLFTADSLATRICNEGLMTNCRDRLTVEAYKVSNTVGAFTIGDPKCIDISEDPDAQPASTYTGAVTHKEHMYIRVCLLVDTLFKTTPLTPTLQKNKSGGYYLSAMGIVTLEPDKDELEEVGS